MNYCDNDSFLFYVIGLKPHCTITNESTRKQCMTLLLTQKKSGLSMAGIFPPTDSPLFYSIYLLDSISIGFSHDSSGR